MSSCRAFLPVLAIYVGLLAGCGEHQESWFYPNLSEADKAGAITRGWVPDDILPASSRNIRVVGELSPSKEWCAFEFSPADAETLRKNLKGLESLPPSVRKLRSPGASWWPEVLTGNLDVAKIEESGFQIYAVMRRGETDRIEKIRNCSRRIPKELGLI